MNYYFAYLEGYRRIKKRDDYRKLVCAPFECSSIRSCFFPGPRAVANFGMSAALRPVLGAFQPSPPAPLREKKAPSESCWPVDFRMDAVSPYRFILPVSLLRAGCSPSLPYDRK